MKYIVYIFLLFPILVTAQTYKYIGNLRKNGRMRTKCDKWLVHIPFLCYLTILLISAKRAEYGGY